MAEQLVGQELLASGAADGDELVYWLREGRSNNAEVDYVVALGGEIVPVEVKSGEAGSLKSLFVFAERHASRRAVRFDLAPPSRRRVTHAARDGSGGVVEVELRSLPLYAVGQLTRLWQAPR